MRTALVFGLFGLCARMAIADDAADRVAAARKLLDAQAKALVADDSNAFDATLAPGAYQNVQTDLMPPAKIVVGTPKVGWADTCGWVSAEAQVTMQPHPEGMTPGVTPKIPARTWHWLALVVPDGAGLKAKAVNLASTTPDRALRNDVYTATAKLPAVKDGTPLVALLAHPSDAAKHVATDPATTVYGTSDRDRAYGKTAAKKLLASWATLGLEVVTDKDTQSDHWAYGEVTAGDCAASHAMLRLKVKEGFVLLEGFAIAHKVADGWELVALDYASERVGNF